MATNAATDDKSTVADDDKQVTEEDLRDLKYPKDDVEGSKETDETSDGEENEEDSEETGDDDGQTDDEATDEETEETDETDSADDSSDYVKEFPNIKGDTLEDYARNLEKAYQNSTSEALRLKKLADEGKPKETDDKEETDSAPTDPIQLFMKQKMDEEINEAYKDFSKSYPQVNDAGEYNKFTQEVSTLSQTILQSQKRLASPRELYSKAAVILGWESDATPSGKDKLSMAVKGQAAVSKTTSSSGKPKTKSKVTDGMIAASKLMYPGKSDHEIREELEPYVQ